MSKTTTMKSIIAYDKIRRLILSGRKLPGSHLTVSELEQELNIGRGAVREALIRLTRSGLATTIPYKGVMVNNVPQYEELEYLFFMRKDLEKKLAIDAFEFITKKDIQKLEKIHAQMEKLEREPLKFFELDRRFHNLIYQKSQLNHLVFIANTLFEAVVGFLNIHLQQQEHYHKFNQGHKRIIDCLKQKDKDGLARELEQNIAIGLIRINSTFERIMSGKTSFKR